MLCIASSFQTVYTGREIVCSGARLGDRDGTHCCCSWKWTGRHRLYQKSLPTLQPWFPQRRKGEWKYYFSRYHISISKLFILLCYSVQVENKLNVVQFQLKSFPTLTSGSSLAFLDMIDSVLKIQMATGNRPITVMCPWVALSFNSCIPHSMMPSRCRNNGHT